MDTLDIFETSAGDAEQFEDELTAAKVLQKLEDAWLNEKHSPEILEPRMEIVECMLEQVWGNTTCFNMIDEGFRPAVAGEHDGGESVQVEKKEICASLCTGWSCPGSGS